MSQRFRVRGQFFAITPERPNWPIRSCGMFSNSKVGGAAAHLAQAVLNRAQRSVNRYLKEMPAAPRVPAQHGHGNHGLHGYGPHLQALAQPFPRQGPDPRMFQPVPPTPMPPRVPAGRAVPMHPALPTIRQNMFLAPTRFAQAVSLPVALQTRKVGELQDLEYGEQKIAMGVMTCYPGSPQEVADMFRKAIGRAAPARIVNLANSKAFGIPESYAAELPINKVVKICDMDVLKAPGTTINLGSNGQGRQLYDEQCTIWVRDKSKPNATWEPIEYHEVKNWIDRSSLPPVTFERVSDHLERPYFDQGVIHCHGGVGRTAVMIIEGSLRSYLKYWRSHNRPVSHAEANNFVNSLLATARAMRGGFVLPDEEQTAMLMRSCHLAVARHQQSFGIRAF